MVTIFISSRKQFHLSIIANLIIIGKGLIPKHATQHMRGVFYRIVSTSHRGLRSWNSPPEPLTQSGKPTRKRIGLAMKSENSISNFCGKGSFLFRHYNESISSTQDELKHTIQEVGTSIPELFETSTVPMLVVSAAEQSQGRGTNKRTWNSVKGNTFVSIGFPMSSLPVSFTLLPLQVGVIVAQVLSTRLKDVINKSSNQSENKKSLLSLKWPNDVLIDDKKIAGVLIETTSTSSTPLTYYFVVGIGVNIANAPQIPAAGENRGRKSTCLADYITLEDENVAVDIALDIARALSKWLNDGVIMGSEMKGLMESNILSTWNSLAQANMGRRLEIRDSTNRISVIPIGIEPDGQLRVKYPDGRITLLSMTDYLF